LQVKHRNCKSKTFNQNIKLKSPNLLKRTSFNYSF